MTYYNPKMNDKWLFKSYYKEFHFLLGKIVVNYNLIETKFMFLICNLLDTKDIKVGLRECKGKGTSYLLEMIKKLIKKKGVSSIILKQHANLNEQLLGIIEERNRNMHSMYFDTVNFTTKLTSKTKYISKVSLRDLQTGNKNPETKILADLTSLKALVQWIDHLNMELDKFANLLRNEMIIKDIDIKIDNKPLNKKGGVLTIFPIQ